MAIEKFYIKRNDLQPYYTSRLLGSNTTSLMAQATHGDSAVTVASTEGFSVTGSIVLSDYVSIAYTGKSMTTFTGCTWTGGVAAQVFALGTSIQEVVSITGATIRFTLSTVDGVTKKVNRQLAIITNGSLGDYEYRWQSGDTNTIGTYLAEFEITPSASPKFTVPVNERAIVVIVADLDAI